MIINKFKVTLKIATIIMINYQLYRKLIKVKVVKDYHIIKDNNKITLFKKTLKKLKLFSNYRLNKIKNSKVEKTKISLYLKLMKMIITLNKIHK